MQQVVGKASAFVAALRAAISAAASAVAASVSRAKHAAALQWADTSPKLVLYGRFLHGRARRLQPPAVRLIAASAALVLTLLALALPGGNNGKVLASVELALGPRSDGVAGATADEILIEFPLTQTAAKAGTEVPLAPTEALAPMQAVTPTEARAPVEAPAPPEENTADAATTAPTEPPNLAGLAEIPQELIANPPKKKGAATRNASFAAPSETRENLPWKATEPVMFTPMGPGEQKKPGAAPAMAAAPGPLQISGADIGKWTKGKATKIMGAQRTKPLYHFVVWVEPPKSMQAHVAGVSYDFSSPAVQPQSQASMDRDSGFKINAAGLACADKITVTLRFDDGRVEKTNIDGCELFNNA